MRATERAPLGEWVTKTISRDRNCYIRPLKANPCEPGAGPAQITSAPDGNLYFTEEYANEIGRFNLLTERFDTEALIPTPNTKPRGNTVGPPDDDSVWFTEKQGDKIGRLRTVTFCQSCPVIGAIKEARALVLRR